MARDVKARLKTCGDFGGRNQDGSPCRHRVNEGLCRYHTAEAKASEAEAKRVFLEAYEEVPVALSAAAKAGISPQTLARWREADLEFDIAVSALMQAGPDRRRDMVEESLFVRIVNGKAAAAETIFWLVNDSRRRGDKRWLNTTDVRIEAPDTTTLIELLDQRYALARMAAYGEVYAAALEAARRDPAAVEEWGREQGLLPPGERTDLR